MAAGGGGLRRTRGPGSLGYGRRVLPFPYAAGRKDGSLELDGTKESSAAMGGRLEKCLDDALAALNKRFDNVDKHIADLKTRRQQMANLS